MLAKAAHLRLGGLPLLAWGAAAPAARPPPSADTAISTDERALFLATAPIGRADWRAALAVVLASLLAFAVSVPFAKVPLAPLPAFIPIYQSIIVITDLITAILLFGQFDILRRSNMWRSSAVLVLASAYLFTACLASAHILSFPGLFSPSGLLGAGPQTTAWLYMFWHGGFPLMIVAYAYLRERGSEARSRHFGRRRVVAGVGFSLAAAAALILLSTAGHDWLPQIMDGNRYTPAMLAVVSSVCSLSLLALATLCLRKSQTVLDLWLIVVMCAWTLDIALSAVLNGGRFDLGFYAGRIYGLLATSFVLVMLLIETSRMYGRLLETHKSERRKAEELKRLTTLDPLTGIANRRAFETALYEEWRRMLRRHTPLCLIMIDVDCFKRFNDTYGHVAGDQCLRAVAGVLASNTRRAGEVAARYGGEEFAVLLPHADMSEAHRLAQKICQDVRDLRIPHVQSTAADHVTISVGVASARALMPASGSSDRARLALANSASLLIEKADTALYVAKTSGRDRVTVASLDPAPDEGISSPAA